MQIKQLFQDEDAVSPVIGVILMVAITVILAAVIGTFVLGLGDQVQSSAPNANFQFEYDDGATAGFASGETDETITIQHNGGQDVEDSNLAVNVGGTDVTADLSLAIGGDGTWSTGDSATYTDSGSIDLDGGEDVLVIWQSPNGDSSNTIGESAVPN